MKYPAPHEGSPSAHGAFRVENESGLSASDVQRGSLRVAGKKEIIRWYPGWGEKIANSTLGAPSEWRRGTKRSVNGQGSGYLLGVPKEKEYLGKIVASEGWMEEATVGKKKAECLKNGRKLSNLIERRRARVSRGTTFGNWGWLQNLTWKGAGGVPELPTRLRIRTWCDGVAKRGGEKPQDSVRGWEIPRRNREVKSSNPASIHSSWFRWGDRRSLRGLS